MEIPAQEFQIQIIIEGIRGHGHRSDMAIDDVILIPGPCGMKGRVILELCYNPSMVSREKLLDTF